MILFHPPGIYSVVVALLYPWPYLLQIYPLFFLVKEFEEKIGEGLGLSGIQDTWTAAREGKAFKLLVEKDYRQPGFILAENEYHLYLHPPKKTYKVLADAVDDIIETVLEKKRLCLFC